MQVIARRAVLAGAGALAAASVATALLLRKPAPTRVVLTPEDAVPRLQGIAALRRIAPAQPMPAITIRDAGGAAHSLTGFAGKGVVLNVWATWCAPCVAEMPALAALAAKVAADGIEVVPLSVDRGGAAVVQAFYAAHHITGLGVWTDADGQAGRALDISGVPTTFVIDRRGRKAALLEGPAEWGSDAAAAAIRSLV